jgi:hypothetical protein
MKGKDYRAERRVDYQEGLHRGRQGSEKGFFSQARQRSTMGAE